MIGTRALLLLLALAGCAGSRTATPAADAAAAVPDTQLSGPGQPSPPPPAGAWTATITAPPRVTSSSDLAVTLTLSNTGTTPVTFRRGELEIAQLALVVTDAQGQRMPTVSPPVPREGDADLVVIEPGKIYPPRTLGLDIFSPPLPAGVYAIGCSFGCAPITVRIGP